MVIALDPLEARPFICKADRNLPEEDQTVWMVKPLSAKEKMTLEDKHMQASAKSKKGDEVETTFDIRMHKRNYEALNIGLTGWSNFKDGEGNEIPCKKTTLRGGVGFADTLLSRIPEGVRGEISEAILEGFDAESERD
jgi:hypothetical protein